MILTCSWISLPCLSSRVIIRVFSRLCVLLTFFRLLAQLFLGFHLSCASGYLPSLSFLWSYISPHILCGLWGSRSLSFLYASSSEVLLAMIFSGFSVSWFVLLCSMHFVGLFQSCSYLDCPCRHVLLVL